MICAARSGARTNLDKEVLPAFRITLNGKSILIGIEWASRHKVADIPIGREANCRLTKAPSFPSLTLKSNWYERSFDY